MDIAQKMLFGVGRVQPKADARLRHMFDQYFGLVWKFVLRMGVPASMVDDAVQEVFCVASRRLEHIERGKERPYLIGVALRVSSQFRRSERRRLTTPAAPQSLDTVDERNLPADELIELRRAREVLDRILAAMPEDVRAVFVLCELEQMTVAEAAECLDVQLGTAKSRLKRARQLFGESAERHRRASARSGRRP